MAVPIQGVLLPAITPFIDGAVDIATYKRMLLHLIVEATIEVAGGRMPIFVGVCSNSTNKAAH